MSLYLLPIDAQPHTKCLGFISREWKVRTRAAFAGSCIGVILLVIALEFLRRLGREYDALLHRKDSLAAMSQGKTEELEARTALGPKVPSATMVQRQLVRAGIHMLQFAVAYFIMLLAMYYNGGSWTLFISV